ncbi:universal stress protein [Botryobacter ruber]|uniref:universal stress protein n=1 Tax=Botryobacter ruber TaxID=2171629 RepID=UPI000E0A771D|nr:universal stress protein [Botryobacter ruber]
MYTLKKLMVGLDLTKMDETLIRYAAFLCSQSSIRQVLFVHIIQEVEIPEELKQDYRQQNVPLERSITSDLETKVSQYFAQLPQVQTEIQVVEGKPLKGLLRGAKQYHPDLMLVGRKLHLRGSGVLPQKLLRSGKTSILFLPENAEPVLKKILVSIDFSDCSLMALDRVLHSALTRPDVEVSCLHVYEVPTGYITLGESYADFEDRMKGFATEKFDQVLAKFPELGSRTSLKLVKRESEDDIGELIVLHAKRDRADMLVIGAKGKSAAAVFMVGSVTEKILRHDNDIPLTVFKNEKEETGLLDALLTEE